jgi:hypothetical protein
VLKAPRQSILQSDTTKTISQMPREKRKSGLQLPDPITFPMVLLRANGQRQDSPPLTIRLLLLLPRPCPCRRRRRAGGSTSYIRAHFLVPCSLASRSLRRPRQSLSTLVCDRLVPPRVDAEQEDRPQTRGKSQEPARSFGFLFCEAKMARWQLGTSQGKGIQQLRTVKTAPTTIPLTAILPASSHSRSSATQATTTL